MQQKNQEIANDDMMMIAMITMYTVRTSRRIGRISEEDGRYKQRDNHYH